MKKINIFLFLAVLVGLNGCLLMQSNNYENFKKNQDKFLNTSDIPWMFYYKREIYDENRYIYKFERPAGCHFGFLTNRDKKQEVVQEWIILSGKEKCQSRPNVSLPH
ncbi:hypothetical protein CR66_09455 [Campylobacter mucosalis]|uniref:hypothetical protein n=1 Tax=Campylobacter mucosalis TaxID=202 RepID=UPI0004D3FC60|nr:hypothetical protein [Campylobacter mucosalis]KEA45185.1 hypothetical protein CR66_09455 [Campylobacter mucosalis]QKF63854.1 hypothetical protein CMCT_1758 [Campylobacter mucosalis]